MAESLYDIIRMTEERIIHEHAFNSLKEKEVDNIVTINFRAEDAIIVRPLSDIIEPGHMNSGDEDLISTNAVTVMNYFYRNEYNFVINFSDSYGFKFDHDNNLWQYSDYPDTSVTVTEMYDIIDSFINGKNPHKGHMMYWLIKLTPYLNQLKHPNTVSVTIYNIEQGYTTYWSKLLYILGYHYYICDIVDSCGFDVVVYPKK